MTVSMLGYDYNQWTLAQVRAKLQSRLNDSNGCFWGTTELNFYLQEALDAFSVYGRYFSAKATLLLPANTMEASLDSLTLTSGSGVESPVSFAVSGQKILTSSLLHLLETRQTSIGAVTLSGQFTSSLLNSYISLAVNQFLQDTSIFIQKKVYPSSPDIISDQGYYTLPSDVSNLARFLWTTPDGTTYPVMRQDSEFVNMLDPTAWSRPGIPLHWSVATNNSRRIYVQPYPSDVGTTTLYYIPQVPSTIDLFSGDYTYTLPYEFWFAVKYLVLYRIYSTDGPTSYPSLAQYCAQRYSQLIQLARDWTCIDDGWSEEEPMFISNLSSFDQMYPTWLNRPSKDLEVTSSKPDTVFATYGSNRIFFPRKYTRDTSYTFDIARNVPTLSDTDYFPVGEDFLPSILDYAEHLSLLKCGGLEFSQSMSLLNSFYSACARINSRITANIPIDQSRAVSQWTRERVVNEFDTQETGGTINETLSTLSGNQSGRSGG